MFIKYGIGILITSIPPCLLEPIILALTSVPAFPSAYQSLSLNKSYFSLNFFSLMIMGYISMRHAFFGL